MAMNSRGTSLCCVAMSVTGVVVALSFELALLAALAASVVSENQALIRVFASCSILFTLACCAAFRVLAGELEEHRRNNAEIVERGERTIVLSHHKTVLQG